MGNLHERDDFRGVLPSDVHAIIFRLLLRAVPDVRCAECHFSLNFCRWAGAYPSLCSIFCEGHVCAEYRQCLIEQDLVWQDHPVHHGRFLLRMPRWPGGGPNA